MEVRLFGDVELLAADGPVDVGTPRQRAVLAALAVDRGRPVPLATLVDRVWGEAPPEQARNVLYSHLSRIRRLVRQGGDADLVRRAAGYVLEIDVDAVDLHRFARLAEHGRDSRLSDVDQSAALTEALELWTGTLLAGVAGDWAEQVRTSWQRRRLDAATTR
jgi:DNA-binding SARP family transcriptional activator